MIKKLDAMTIQVTPVFMDCTGDVKYLYEEIDNNDFVTYSHYISIETVKRLYPEALQN